MALFKGLHAPKKERREPQRSAELHREKLEERAWFISLAIAFTILCHAEVLRSIPLNFMVHRISSNIDTSL